MRLPIKQVTSYDRHLPIGSTKPFLVSSGNDSYVVKAFDEECENKHLINEFICKLLADLLEVPTPDAALLQIDKKLISSIDELNSRNMKSTLLFGSKLLEPVQANITPPLLERILNTDDIPSIILFDQIIYNNDRAHNSGNLLIELKAKKLYAIDHSHVFKDGLIWTEHSLNDICSQQTNVVDNFHDKYYRMLTTYINGHAPFYKIQHKIDLIDENSISTIIDAVPKEWELKNEEAQAIKRFILHRIQNIDDIFKRIQEEWPHWKGGL